MMALGEVIRELYPFVVALYLVDALAWVSSREVVFASLNGERFRIRRSGISLFGLLPIAIDIRVASHRPILTRIGILVPPEGQVTAGALSDPAEYSEVVYEDAARATVEHTTIHFPGSVCWKAPTAAAARKFRARIVEIAELPEEEREEMTGELLRVAFDPNEARRRLRDFMDEADSLVVLDDALFFALLVVIPGSAILVPGNPVFLLTIVLLSLCLWVVTGVATIRLARRLERRGLAVPDALRLATVLLMPPTAFRGAHALASDLLHDLEPVAVAAALGPLDGLSRIARAELATVERALGAGGGGDWSRAWTLRSELLTGLLDGVESNDEIVAPPVEFDGDLVCPECGVAYRSGFDRCSDCDVALAATLPVAAARSR